jgi:hypothetical protein
MSGIVGGWIGNWDGSEWNGMSAWALGIGKAQKNQYILLDLTTHDDTPPSSRVSNDEGLYKTENIKNTKIAAIIM